MGKILRIANGLERKRKPVRQLRMLYVDVP